MSKRHCICFLNIEVETRWLPFSRHFSNGFLWFMKYEFRLKCHWQPVDSLVHTLLHGVELLIMVGWPQLLCKPGMTPALSSGYPNVTYQLEMSFWVRNSFTRSANCRSHLQWSYQPTASTHVGRDVIGITWIMRSSLWRSPYFPNSGIAFVPEQFIFNSDSERR